ncbi:nucleotidyltransferase domain-containing protein (plasmid) [Cytobacillus firmus]|uniref:type VII toxin-antitoxin system MntA family adenylyltransferase antitoxin n=1 Tax=Cytobacillus firmus TaxID=1399 RepID=UPI00220FA24A|nr:nucleotidyltransferase domain-containing protein [Cytobacillus firmus]USK41845.1 nucleotidyltransferase domain-containing protein [Cytobacillus firmus]
MVLFGSTVSGNSHKESDIDIAYLSSTKKADKNEIFMVAQELAAKLNKDVDLIDINQASTVFQAQIVQSGTTIYCTNEQKLEEFEMKVLKMYSKLNEERSEILRKIDESGTIYEK